MEELSRRKFTICNIQRVQLEKDDVDFLFCDIAPRLVNIETLWGLELSKGQSCLIVVEREKAISEL